MNIGFKYIYARGPIITSSTEHRPLRPLIPNLQNQRTRIQIYRCLHTSHLSPMTKKHQQMMRTLHRILLLMLLTLHHNLPLQFKCPLST